MQTQYEKITQTPVERLIGTMALPTVISMLVTNVYNLADAYFVGQVNTSASGAIGIVLSVQAIIQAFGFTCGHGSGSIISRKLGHRDTESADVYASTGFFLAFGIGMIIQLFGISLLDPVLRLLGSTETILPYARSYAKYILLAAPFMASSCVLNNIIRYEGRAVLATIGLATGGILNMVLDPILMFGFGMGIDGAGAATAISQLISFGLLLFMFLSGKTQSKISLKKFTRSFADIRLIFATGFPSLLRQGLASVSTMALNHGAAIYGDAAIAAMSIVNRICLFIVSTMIGIGQGLQPVAAFNYGAEKYDRVRKAFRFTFLLGEAVLSVAAVAFFAMAPWLVGVFRNDPAVIAIGVPALRIQCVSLFTQPMGVCANMLFQSIGESRKATTVSALRSGVYFLPLILLLPRLFGLAGLQSAQAVADVLTFFTALPMVLRYFRYQMPDVRPVVAKV